MKAFWAGFLEGFSVRSFYRSFFWTVAILKAVQYLN